MQRILASIIVATGVGLLVAVAAVPTVDVAAAPSCTGIDCVGVGVDKVPTGPTQTVDNVAKTIVNVLLFIIGVVSVVMIVIGGISYTTSSGDSNKVTAAKNTILYAVIGLVVAILAYALVDFVIDTFTAPPA